MTDPAHLSTSAAILRRAGLSPTAPTFQAGVVVLALHLAALPPEPEMWGAPEPMSSEDHLSAAVVDACRTTKGLGWVPDPLGVAALATSSVSDVYQDWMKATTAKYMRESAGVAPAATEPDDLPQGDDGGEPEPTCADGTAEGTPNAETVTAPAPETSGGDPSVDVQHFPSAAETRGLAHALVDVILDSHGLETGPDGVVRRKMAAHDVISADVAVLDVEPAIEKARKPRCGLPYTHRKIEADGTTINEDERPCTRPAGHKGDCGEAKVVGRKA